MSRGLAWREDATNASDRFARGRVREGLVPALEAVDPRAVDNVLRTAELLRDEAEVLDVVVETALAGRDRIAVAHLAALPRGAGAPGRAAPRRGRDGRAVPAGGARLDGPARPRRRRAGRRGGRARRSWPDGVLRFEPTPPLGARSRTAADA